ncbi:MAG: hypothetical protein JWO74_2168 [Solirubrobacterales bacterium]|nr:hypothetical protein [Solirubrobacterales bacterium]
MRSRRPIGARRRVPARVMLVVWAAALATAAPQANGAGAATRRACPPRHAKVIAASGQAVAFRIGAAVYGCARGRRPVKLGYLHRPSDDLEPEYDNVRRVRVAGPYVAYEHEYGDPNSASYRIQVRDLRTRRYRRDLPTGNLTDPSRLAHGDSGVGPATRIVMTPRSSVAWIVRNIYSPDVDYEVWKANDDKPMMLASGSDVDHRFLSIRRHQVRWRQGGRIHTSYIR